MSHKKRWMIGLQVIAIFLCASVALSAPINPINLNRPVTIGVGDGLTLQQIFDAQYGVSAPNVVTGQSTAAMWGFTNTNGSSAPTILAEFGSYAPNNTFGMWFATDTTSINLVPIFKGSAQPGEAALISWNPGTSTLSVFGGSWVYSADYAQSAYPWINPNSFGFYLQGPGGIFYSLDQLNSGNAQILAYNVSGTSDWLFGIEDVRLSEADKDYNDMVVKVESIRRVPEPMTLMLLGAGLLGLGILRKKS
jgi:hypothetical protein